MQSPIAEQLLSMAGLRGGSEGSISGDAIAAAIASLDKALAEWAELGAGSKEEEDEAETVALDARAAPLREMLRNASQIGSYVMWRPE